jgi:NAD(P)-dependent dehydrogenase (short-subunit alcohol dehydrogenase family)
MSIICWGVGGLVVTGASDGIGREFAIQLARAGFNVLLAARNQTKLDAVVHDIGALISLKATIPFLLICPLFVVGWGDVDWFLSQSREWRADQDIRRRLCVCG